MTDERTRALAELRGAEGIDILSCVIELVLDKRHELGIATLPAVIGIQGDDEVRNGPNQSVTCWTARARDHFPIAPCGDPVSH
ncbi:hypothetical protein ABID21_005014 [Pseudorhizobium tarimense]|uniref:Uncharacterized protein n=1 Tax=Pseudorhizobium tarimense TaxID=1079109 RepID=A0ABV2HEC1_9HYPH